MADHVLHEKRGRAGIITLNRPKAINALTLEMFEEITRILRSWEDDSDVSLVILRGAGERGLCAGGDIASLYQDAKDGGTMGQTFWKVEYELDYYIHTYPKPYVAIMNGIVLGGGCELAMMCDIIIAGDTAKFGQPEVNLGVTPGMGGSQRLTRAIGKSKAMEMCLTGRQMGAEEAERSGLVARVVPAEELVDAAKDLAEEIAQKSLVATTMIKEQINAVDELSLSQGLMYERRTFHSIFASEDQKEGMQAFTEKRKANFQHR